MNHLKVHHGLQKFVETQTEELEAHSCTEYFKIFKTSWGMQRHFSWKQNNKDLHAFDYMAILWNVQFLLNALRRRGVVDYRATWNTFQLKLEKQKKSTLKKVIIFFHKKCFLIFWEMEISSPKLKKISHIFPKKIFSYISGGHFSKLKIKKNPLRKNFLYFFHNKFSHISSPRFIKKLMFFLKKSNYISRGNFPSLIKTKIYCVFSIFQRMELSSHKSKKFLIIFWKKKKKKKKNLYSIFFIRIFFIWIFSIRIFFIRIIKIITVVINFDVLFLLKTYLHSSKNARGW